MYTQMAFVTSVRGITFLPQIAANASLSFFGAKMPLPAFLAIMPIVFFSALVLRSSALVIVAFLVLVVATVVLATVVFATVVLATVVLVVICERGNANTH